MSERYRSLVVVLREDCREGWLQEKLIPAILCLSGVAEVRTGDAVDHRDYANRSAVRRELEAKLWKALEDES